MTTVLIVSGAFLLFGCMFLGCLICYNSGWTEGYRQGRENWRRK